MKRLLRFSALLCLCSVSLNTPKTFELYPFLRPVTFACDLTTALLFTAEMVVKINTRGLLKVITNLTLNLFLNVLFHELYLLGGRFLPERPVVSVRHKHAFLPVDISYTPST